MKKGSKKQGPTKGNATSVKFEADLSERIGRAAFKLDISKLDIIRHGTRALVEALEKADYKIEWPPAMQVCNPKVPLSQEDFESIVRGVITSLIGTSVRKMKDSGPDIALAADEARPEKIKYSPPENAS